MLRVFRRGYAADPKIGSKAKGGTAKTAIKQKDTSQSLPPLPLFKPKPKINPLQNLSAILPQNIDLNQNPAWKRPEHTLMRSIDFDLRKRYDFDDRWKLFSENAPDDLTGSKNNKDRIPIGSVVLVSQVSSRTVPRVQNFAGILVSVKRNGLATNFTLRHTIQNTGVEMKFPLFSPLITSIKVLLRPVENKETGMNTRKDGKGKFENFSMDALRENPRLLPVGYSRIDDIVLRDRAMNSS